ncbi:MAG: hypothetical protein AAFZ07_25645 [Actinomycetota bacterium]
MSSLTDIEVAWIVGVLACNGSFTVDAGQPIVSVQVIDRRHGTVARLHSLVPGSRLHGPYERGRGRPRSWIWRVNGGRLRGLLERLNEPWALELGDDHYRRRLARVTAAFEARHRALTVAAVPA